MIRVPSNLSPDKYVLESMRSAGLYSKKEIEQAKYSKYPRFGRILDPHGRLNNTTQYVFFTKPDLHIVNPGSGGMRMNSELAGNSFFYDLVRLYPDVVRELQSSAPRSSRDPFSHLLSFGVNSALDVPSIEATTIDTPQTMFGTSIEYMGNSEASDGNPTFSLEFVDSKELELYYFFKGYQEYHNERKSGAVTPPSRSYTFQRKLHNVMGCYKFLVDEDMETLIYWAYFWGVYPISAPREAFSDPSFPDGLTYTVNFKAGFVEDMTPAILVEFNNKMSRCLSGKKKIPVYEVKQLQGIDNPIGWINGTLPSAARIAESGRTRGHNGRSKYKFEWYG